MATRQVSPKKLLGDFDWAARDQPLLYKTQRLCARSELSDRSFWPEEKLQKYFLSLETFIRKHELLCIIFSMMWPCMNRTDLMVLENVTNWYSNLRISHLFGMKSEPGLRFRVMTQCTIRNSLSSKNLRNWYMQVCHIWQNLHFPEDV